MTPIDDLPGDLRRALERIARVGQGMDDWRIIGSSALMLSGLTEVQPDDVDVVGSAQTIFTMLDRMQCAAGMPEPGVLFRSHPYVRISSPDSLAIEVMGDLEVKQAGVWRSVLPLGQIPYATDFGPVYVPTVEQQLMLLERFGREKDIQRAALLRARMEQD